MMIRSRSRRSRCTAVLAATVLLSLAACSSSSGSASSGSSGSSEVKVGLLFDKSGPLAAFSKIGLDGARLAAKQINDGGGFTVAGKKYTINLVETDPRSDVSRASLLTKQLIRDDKVSFIMGPTANEELYASQAVSRGTVTQVADSAGIGLVAEKNSSAFAYQPQPSPSVWYPGWIKQLKTRYPNIKRMAHLIENDDTGKVLAAAAEQGAKAQGIEITTRFYDPTQTDFTSDLTALKATHPDVLAIGIIPPLYPTQLKQAVQLDVATTAYLAPLGDESLAVGATAPVPKTKTPIFLTRLSPVLGANATSAERKQAADGVKAATGADLPADGLQYQLFLYSGSLQLFVKAMEKAGTTTDQKKINEALKSVSYDTPVGTMTFGDHFLTAFPQDLVVVTNGAVSTREHLPAG
ncbi:MAG: amino acid/amide transporter substrate-binding protein family [Acidimicrobiales bacterium]|nr:amino acid/amide transporter substrate-binding protein family [Acidimicrobiales bacterium]